VLPFAEKNPRMRATAGIAGGSFETFDSPRLILTWPDGQPLNFRSDCFALMMRCTKALTIVWIECTTTILELDDVVGIHAVGGCCLDAPMAMAINSLAPGTGTGDHLGSPPTEGWAIVDRVFDLGSWRCGVGMASNQHRRQRPKLGHRYKYVFALRGSLMRYSGGGAPR
jgi:hypothetical protein